ncbi:MAG TPA: hypothetical protein VG184_11835 [Acidimicrobiales bacterium]|nr:hypothetical protein [Acidimicrobiales bacterium]
MAMIIAMMVTLVVIAGSIAAVNMAMGAISETSQTRKDVQSLDAADAGLQVEITNVRNANAAGNDQKIACPTGAQVTQVPSTSTTGAPVTPNVDAGGVASYTLSVNVGATPAFAASGLAACTGQFGLVSTTSPSYVLIQATGVTLSTPAISRSVQTLVKVTPAVAPTPPTTTYAQMGNFNYAIFGEDNLQPSGTFVLSDSYNRNSANAFTDGLLNCTSKFVYSGNVQAYGPMPATPEEANGACAVKANLYVNGSVDLTAGATISQNVYTTGTAVLNGGLAVGGSLYADGPVTIEAGATVGGNVYANGPVTIMGGSTIAGNVYAMGNVTMSGSASVAGSIEAQGGNITYSGNTSSNAAYVQPGYSISPACTSKPTGKGAASCYYTLGADFPASSVFPTTANLPSPGPFPAVAFDQAAWQADGYTNFVTNNNCTADNGSGSGISSSSVYAAIIAMSTAGAPNTVIQTTCQITWGDDPNKPSTLSLAANLAIFANGGFSLPSSFTGGVGSTTSTTHDLYLIVPAAQKTLYGATCPALPPALATAGDFSAADNVGNIVIGTNLSINQKIHDFVYTPNSICNSSTTNIFGRAYANGTFSTTGTYTHSYYAITPWSQVTSPPVTNTTISSTASSQAVNLALLNGSVPVVETSPTSATNNGTPPNTVNQGPQPISLLSGDTFLTAGALSEYAEADTNGTSYACAGVLQASGVVTLGTTSPPTSCNDSLTGGSGLTLDISQLPGLGSLLSSVADVKLNASAAMAFATENGTGVASGNATFANATVAVCVVPLAGICTAPITVSLNVPSAANQDLLATIIAALTAANNPLLTTTINTLTNTIAPLLILDSNYQVAGCAFSDSAIHIGLVNNLLATADIAKASAGCNSTTTTTTPGTTVATVPPLNPAAILVQWYRVV